MGRLLIAFHSRTGHVETMAREVEAGAIEAGAEVTCSPVSELAEAALMKHDGLVLGSPAYYGLPAAPVKSFLDASVGMHGRLEGKVGGAFASAGNIGGGNETTVLAMVHAMLVHGMIVQGTAQGDHYGPVAVGAPDSRALVQCRELGKRVATLIERLHG